MVQCPYWLMPAGELGWPEIGCAKVKNYHGLPQTKITWNSLRSYPGRPNQLCQLWY